MVHKRSQQVLQCLTMDQIAQKLEDAGLAPTAQRLAIAQFVLCEGDHPTAEDVEQGVQAKLPMISRATVYNTLGKLVECGLLLEVRSPREESLRYDGNIEPHHHLIDSKSGKMLDIPFEQIAIQNLEGLQKKYKIERISVTIEGSEKGN